MTTIRVISATSVGVSVLAGAAVGVLSFLCLFVVVLTAGAETIPQTAQGWWMFLGFFVVGNLVTVGTPVALYLRFEFVSPFFVLGADLLFWLFLANQGDAPGYFFAIALWPVYLVVYLIAVAIEQFVRTGGLAAMSSIL